MNTAKPDYWLALSFSLLMAGAILTGVACSKTGMSTRPKGTDGAVSSDGMLGTGGMTTDGTTYTGGSKPDASSDAAAAGCSCSSSSISWACYCQAYGCGLTLDAYYADGGPAPSGFGMEEFKDCNLVVVWTKSGFDPRLRHVFDLNTRQLVGEEQGSDVPSYCPFGPDAGFFWKLSAGQFPSSSCVRSRCSGWPGDTPCLDGGI